MRALPWKGYPARIVLRQERAKGEAAPVRERARRVAAPYVGGRPEGRPYDGAIESKKPQVSTRGTSLRSLTRPFDKLRVTPLPEGEGPGGEGTLDAAPRERFTHAGGLAVNTRYVLLLLLATSICAIALATACGGSSPKGSSSAQMGTPTLEPGVTVTPTPLFGWKSVSNSTASNAQEAVGFAREEYSACPPYCTTDSDFRSVEYVQTTKSKLRQVIGPAKSHLLGDPGATVEGIDAPEDWPVWAVVARGSFHGRAAALATQEYHVGSNFWVLVPKDRQGFGANFATDTNYDISQLGEVHDVPLPLAKWPTPVALASSP